MRLKLASNISSSFRPSAIAQASFFGSVLVYIKGLALVLRKPLPRLGFWCYICLAGINVVMRWSSRNPALQRGVFLFLYLTLAGILVRGSE